MAEEPAIVSLPLTAEPDDELSVAAAPVVGVPSVAVVACGVAVASDPHAETNNDSIRTRRIGTNRRTVILILHLYDFLVDTHETPAYSARQFVYQHSWTPAGCPWPAVPVLDGGHQTQPLEVDRLWTGCRS